jgi:hypothetical protein
MNRDQVEAAAASLLASHLINRVPVNLAYLVRRAGIELTRIREFGAGFSGRIEYDPEDHSFVVYVPCASKPADKARIRFTIAHELGHYCLHRALLCRDGSLPQRQLGESGKGTEREADQFAAATLIPAWWLQKNCDPCRQAWDLAKIIEVAATCEVSNEVAAFRYALATNQRHCSVVSKAGRILHWFSSSAVGPLRFQLRKGQATPQDGPTHHALQGTSTDIVHLMVDGRQWFRCQNAPVKITEEARPLGGGRVLTALTWNSW